MKVMKSKITLLSLAIGSLFAASAAHAVVNLIPATPTGSVAYASEIKFPLVAPGLPNTGTSVTTPAGPFDVTFALGFGASNGDTRFVRFDLSNGATWGTALVNGNLADNMAMSANLTAGNITVVSGGGAAQSFVVYQINITGVGLLQTAQLNFAPPSISPASTSAPVAITYRLFETGTLAAAQTSPLATATGNMITFSPGVLFSFGTPQAETIAATTGFTKFCAPNPNTNVPGTAGCAASTSTDLNALIGTITSYKNDTNVRDATSAALGANVVTPINGLTATTGTAVTVAGNFAGVTAVYYIDAMAPAACTSAGSTAGTFTSTLATFTFGTSSLVGANVRSLCATVNGTTSLAAQTFTGTYTPVAGSAAYTAPAPTTAAVGTWVRDGVELQSPWFNFASTAYISRFFLTNTGATAAICTPVAFGEAGNVLTLGQFGNSSAAGTNTVTIPANGQLQILSTDIVASASVASRAAVRFTCAAPSSDIQGRYVVTHSSGAVDSATLLRPGTN